MRCLALIPARSGSKGIIDKNILSFAGKPLMAYSIQQAKDCPSIERIIVSTDSEAYAVIANEYGAETPFLRPKNISNDDSTDLECFQHALDWLKQNEDYEPDIIVQLRPTHPIRTVQEISECITKLIEHPECDSVRTIVEAPETPYKMWFQGKDNILSPVISSNLKDPWNSPRQKLPPCFLQNASIDVIWRKTIVDKNSMSGEKILGHQIKELADIDTITQFRRAELRMRTLQILNNSTAKRQVYCFDIDGVIASLVADNDYQKCSPLTDNISLINLLASKGHYIKLYTARGSQTGIDWQQITKNQLSQWKVNYAELHFGKPAADFYIDDRLLDISEMQLHYNKEMKKRLNMEKEIKSVNING